MTNAGSGQAIVRSYPKLPNGWLHDPKPDGLELPRGSYVTEIYVAIYQQSKDGVGSWDVPILDTAKMFGCSPRTVQRAIAELVAASLVYLSGSKPAAGQRGGSPVNCYSASLRPVRQVRTRRKNAALADKVLGFPYDEDDAAWEDRLGRGACHPDTEFADGVITTAQVVALQDAVRDGVLTGSDAVTLRQLMVEAPVPVDDAHVGVCIDAYVEARDDGYAPEDMLRAIRDYKRWAAVQYDPPTTYLYVLLRRNGKGGHHKALEWTRTGDARVREGGGVTSESRGGDMDAAVRKAESDRSFCVSLSADYVGGMGDVTNDEGDMGDIAGDEGDMGDAADVLLSVIDYDNAGAVARALDDLSPRRAGRFMPELEDAVLRAGGSVKGGCTGRELIEAYKWYLDNGGRLDYVLPWLRDTEGSSMDCAWWCVAHLRHCGSRT